MISRKFITLHKRPLSMLAFCLAAVCLPALTLAQSTPTTIPSPPRTDPKPVRECGYTLSPRPITFSSGPVMNFAFSIEQDNKTGFGTLKQESIEALHDGSKFALNAGTLKDQTNVPVSVMILVDVSKSMRNREFRKLDALKTALHGFIYSPQLGEKDRVAIAKFDSSMQIEQEATTDRAALYNAVDRLGGRNGTLYYKAITESLKEAKKSGIANLIVLSDGVDSSPEAVYYRSTDQSEELQSFEQASEAEIIKLAKDGYGVRIFSIEMGNISERYPSMYVYRDSPARISSATGGGEDYYIDLVELRQHRDYDDRLANQLSAVLEQIRQTYKYDYLLPVTLAGRARQDGKPHTVALNFKLNGCVLPLEVKYIWYPGKPTPEVIGTTIMPAVFIEPNPTFSDGHNALSEVTQIYLLMMGALALLSLMPLIMQRLAEGRETRQIRRAVIRVDRGSPYVGQECPSERSFRPFREGDFLVICPDPKCKLPHHLDCWQQAYGRCYRRNCSLSSEPRPLPEALLKNYKLPVRS